MAVNRREFCTGLGMTILAGTGRRVWAESSTTPYKLVADVDRNEFCGLPGVRRDGTGNGHRVPIAEEPGWAARLLLSGGLLLAGPKEPGRSLYQPGRTEQS